jgi:2-oxoglutarate dehydrogenase E2 component (dihydrolipoamide succinyltransferase)
MALVDVVMPQMGESIAEGTISKWHKKVGERIGKDETLLEISTDKVDSEIPSPVAGIVAELLFNETTTVNVHTVIARINTDVNASMTRSTPASPIAEQKGDQKKEVTSPPTESFATTTGGTLVDVIMPQMGESIAEGTITKWHKKVGEKIGKDETLLEISTDKVDSEIPSPANGVLAEILFPEQTTVGVHTVIGRIMVGSDSVVHRTASVPAEHPITVAKTEPQPRSLVREQPVSDRFYSPLVMNIARTEQIGMTELERIIGTGSGGRVSKKDILSYIEQKKGGTQAPQVPAASVSATGMRKQAPPMTYPAGRVEIVKMDTMRKAIAEHMIRSKHTSAHVGSVSEADLTGIVRFREKNKSAFEKREGFNLTYTPFFLEAVVKALKDYPLLNSSVDGESIIVRKDINLGVAVALENGLIVPVIKNAEQKSLAGLARSLNDLATRARNKKLMPDEVTGGTFTVTNPGGFGNLYGFPIINQPQVAIFGVGAIKKRPVVIDDAIAIRSMVYISMSYDHRIIDGALGGMFMQKVVFYLENFDSHQSL